MIFQYLDDLEGCFIKTKRVIDTDKIRKQVKTSEKREYLYV